MPELWMVVLVVCQSCGLLSWWCAMVVDSWAVGVPELWIVGLLVCQSCG